ncbi:hypothetical protein JXM67_14255 [candidate division WOR-3 bacterium]|nr:hypothetical protein [candidate division WOR-3 bacterium]
MRYRFSVEEFIEVFRTYNTAIEPAHIVAYVLGGAAILFALLNPKWTSRIVAGILALFWIWVGVFYDIVFFSSINTGAYLFGALFIAQGLLLLIFGVFTPKLSFDFKPDFSFYAGLVFILYAMVIYPIIGTLVGHGYPNSPWFGTAPCPTTIFTFGLLLWTNRKVPVYIYILPFLWSLLGFIPALMMGIREDFGLVAAGIAGSVILLIRDRKGSKEKQPRTT